MIGSFIFVLFLILVLISSHLAGYVKTACTPVSSNCLFISSDVCAGLIRVVFRKQFHITNTNVCEDKYLVILREFIFSKSKEDTSF